MKPSSIYNNNPILKLLLDNKLPSLRIGILFLLIFLLGYILNAYDNSLVIKSGTVNFILPLGNGKGIDTVRIADNTLYIKLEKVDLKRINVSATLLNDDIPYQKQNKYNNFKSSITLIRSSLDTLIGSNSAIVIARDLSFVFKVTPHNAVIKCKVYGIGYLEDIGTYFLFMAFIIIIYFLKKLSEKFMYAFTGIEQNGIENSFNYKDGLLKVLEFSKGDDKAEYETKFGKAFKKITLKDRKTKFKCMLAYTVLTPIIVLMSFYLTINEGAFKGNWNFAQDIYPLGFLSNQFISLFLFIIVLLPILIRVILIAYYTIKFSRFFNNSNMFVINTVSGDRAGGLSPLGEVTLYLFYMSISFFPNLFVASLILGNSLVQKIIYPFYFGFTFYLFYFPLSAPHKSMKTAKQNELAKISSKYNLVYNRFLKTSEDGSNKIYLDELKDIGDLYNQTRKMPVWPFDVEIFIKFGAVFFSSILAYLGQILINLIK